MLLTALAAFSALAAPKFATQNVVFVMTDGFRWQEMFTGADRELLDSLKNEGVRKEFWRDTPEARRQTLLPFIWSVVGKDGQIYGNRTKGSSSEVTNGFKFSYPGYNETLTGSPDPRIDSNDYRPNPNVTVFEWLHRQHAFRGKVAAFGAWNVISAIFNPQRAGFPVNAGYDPMKQGRITPGIEMLNKVKAETYRFWGEEPFDFVPYRTAMEYLRVNRPRLLYISLGETDEWAHWNKYDEYLRSARRVDSYVKELWETLQSMPQYRGKTTLVLSTDHGRGDGPQWTSHGKEIPNSEATWMAFLGPDTPARGEVSNFPTVTNGQIASTIAYLLGYDYNAAQPKAAQPVLGAIKMRR